MTGKSTPPPPPGRLQKGLKIVPSLRKAQASQQKLILWNLELLAVGNDPLGKGIALALRKNGVGALFLAITPESNSQDVPRFMSTAAVMAPTKLNLWAGMSWDPKVEPEMWNSFVQNGVLEFTPPGSYTMVTSQRNIIRSAFGILQSEWLTLVRAGPAEGCRGMVAIVTTESLFIELGEAIALIQAPSPEST